jgi:hypothetical protein
MYLRGHENHLLDGEKLLLGGKKLLPNVKMFLRLV